MWEQLQTFQYSVTSYLTPFTSLMELFLSGSWSLDFLKVTNIVPPFCISDKITNLNALLFEYILVIHPIFLVLITCLCFKLHARNYRILVFLWKPFRSACIRIRRKWCGNGSIVHAYATLLLLSFSRLNTVAYNLNRGTVVYRVNGTTLSYVSIYDTYSNHSLQFRAYSSSSDSSYRLILSWIPSSSATLPLSHSAIQESHTALLQLQKEYICRDISWLL